MSHCRPAGQSTRCRVSTDLNPAAFTIVLYDALVTATVAAHDDWMVVNAPMVLLRLRGSGGYTYRWENGNTARQQGQHRMVGGQATHRHCDDASTETSNEG